MAPVTESAKRTTPSELGSLAYEMGRAFVQSVEYYERTGMSTKQATDFMRSITIDTEKIDEAPARDISWNSIAKLSETDPIKADQVWERIKAAARDTLSTGHYAAKAVEKDNTPWDRATFLAVREEFIRDWQPQTMTEVSLIETLAIAHISQLDWTRRLTATAGHCN